MRRRYLSWLMAVNLCGLGWFGVQSTSQAQKAAPLPPSESKALLKTWLNQASKIRSLSAELEQMRELPVLKTKLRRKGKIWFTSDGRLRWQMGDPPNLLVSREKSGSLIVLEPKKGKAQRWTQEALLAQEKKGGGHGFAMMDAMRTPDPKDFEKQFAVNSATAIEGGRYVLDLSLKDAQAANFVRQIELEIHPSQGTLHRMTMVMQDKARLHTIILSQTLNPSIADETFEIDLTGYQLEEHR